MEKRFDFKGAQYRIKIDIKSVSNETYYFINVFSENKRVKKAHFIKVDNDLKVIPTSSNHTFKVTEDDNNLLYAVKENLFGCLIRNFNISTKNSPRDKMQVMFICSLLINQYA